MLVENKENIQATFKKDGLDNAVPVDGQVELQLLESLRNTLDQISQFQRQQQTQTKSALETLAKNTANAKQILNEQEERLHELSISNKLQDLGFTRDQKLQVLNEQEARVLSLKQTLSDLKTQVKELHQEILKDKDTPSDPNFLKLCIYKELGVTFLDSEGTQCLIDCDTTLQRHHFDPRRSDADHAHITWSIISKKNVSF